MSETVETATIFVNEECGTADIKEELVEEEDPLNLDNGKNNYILTCKRIYKKLLVLVLYLFTTLQFRRTDDCW
jgi:hypothetical protein